MRRWPRRCRPPPSHSEGVWPLTPNARPTSRGSDPSHAPPGSRVELQHPGAEPDHRQPPAAAREPEPADRADAERPANLAAVEPQAVDVAEPDGPAVRPDNGVRGVRQGAAEG